MRRCVLVVLAGALAWCIPLAVISGATAGAASAARTAVPAGVWGRAIEVPGSGELNKGGNAQPVFVSCPSAGNCSGGGAYFDGSGNLQAFVVSERQGVWGKAIEMPGSVALNKGGAADLLSVSCASVGYCVAGGFYSDGSHHTQAFVVSQRQGVWGKAIEVPGSAALNKGEIAQLSSVSCPSAGNCTAAGDYYGGSELLQVFVVVTSMSCPSADNCAAGGDYIDASGNQQAFVVSER